MNPFLATNDQLRADFHSNGIPTEKPGFCDHEAFIRIERLYPEYLNHYAAFVGSRQYGADYLACAHKTIGVISTIMHAELLEHGRLGACVDIAGILGRMLEREGIWNCLIKGSLTITFPANAKLKTKYFWSVDEGEFIAGHSWIYAPPFTVVDISIKQQPFDIRELVFLPDKILSREIAPVSVDANDYISPVIRQKMADDGIPKDQHLQTAAPFVPDIFEQFPPICVVGHGGSQLKYAPAAVHAPDGTFETMTNMQFNGLSPYELYMEKVRPAIEGD